MSTVSIPDEAMPVVEVLRRDVPRPTAKLIRASEGQPRFECGKCPMGLHPTAIFSKTPAIESAFAPGSPLRRLVLGQGDGRPAPVSAFWRWWDQLTLDQAREAVDLIWGKQ